jgi:hypothetical protein
MLQYKSNDTNFIQSNQVLVALFIQSKFALEYVCVLFLKTEVVPVKRFNSLNQLMEPEDNHASDTKLYTTL